MIRSHINIASKKRIESTTTKSWCQIVSLRRSVLCSHYTLDLKSHSTWNHIVSLRRSVLCSHITFRSCRARTRSRRTNSVEDIWSFRILIDLILWQNLVKSKKLDSALFASMHASRTRCTSLSYRFLDLLLFVSHRWHILWISYSQIA